MPNGVYRFCIDPVNRIPSPSLKGLRMWKKYTLSFKNKGNNLNDHFGKKESLQPNNISLIGLLLRGSAAAAAESLAVWAVINQIRDCITVNTIHYIAMYIPDSFNFDTVSFLIYRA